VGRSWRGRAIPLAQVYYEMNETQATELLDRAPAAPLLLPSNITAGTGQPAAHE